VGGPVVSFETVDVLPKDGAYVTTSKTRDGSGVRLDVGSELGLIEILGDWDGVDVGAPISAELMLGRLDGTSENKG